MSNINEQKIHQFSHRTLVKELTKRNLSASDDTDNLKTRLIRHCERNNRHSMQQPFDFLAVIDFEATCLARPPHPYIQEIIEFPIVLIDVNQKTIVGTFRSYCRPVLQPILSDYCKQLTGITQEQVDNAPVFLDVFANVEKWLNDRDLLSNSKRKCIFVTDSPSDFNKYLHMQCQLSHIIYPTWGYQWVNIKNTFTQFYSIRSGRISDMLKKLNLPFHGHLHSGLDDATNIGRIAIELIKNGCVLTANEFYEPPMRTIGQIMELPTARWKSSEMICLNCSKSHSETQRSCMQQKQKSNPSHRRYHSDRSARPVQIPSLLDFPLLRHFQSSQWPNTENDMD